MDPAKKRSKSRVVAGFRLLAIAGLMALLLYVFMSAVSPKIASAKDRSFSIAKIKKFFSGEKPKVSAPAGEKKPMVITIEDAVRIALEKNYLFLGMKAKVDEKEAILRRMRTAYLPKLDTTSLYRRWDDSKFMVFSDQRSGTGLGPYNTFDYSATLSQTIYDGGKREAELGKAKAVLDSTESALELEKLNLIYEIKKAYYDALKAANDLKCKQGMLEEKQKSMEVTGNLLKTGAVLKRELLKANVELGQAKYSLKKAENDYKLFLMDLKSKLGLDLSLDIELADSTVIRNLDVDLEQLLLKAFQNGPMVKKLHADVMAAKKDIEKAESGFMRPKLSLESQYGFVNDQAKLENDYWMVEFKVSFPIFDGGQALAEIDQAKAILKQTQAGEKDLKNKLELDVRTAYAKIQELRELLPSIEENVKQAQENIRVEENIFEEGMALSLEVVKANNLLTSVRADYFAAIYDYNLAVAALECAIGEECDQGYDLNYKSVFNAEPDAAGVPVENRP